MLLLGPLGGVFHPAVLAGPPQQPLASRLRRAGNSPILAPGSSTDGSGEGVFIQARVNERSTV